jgi:hypothetical protein
VGSFLAESTVPGAEFCEQGSCGISEEQRIHDWLGGRIVSDPLPYAGKCKHTGKVFGVGMFKTGTSLSADLRRLGYATCRCAKGWWSIGRREFFFLNFDGPSLRRRIEANPLYREALRAQANATLSATDAPWLFFFKVRSRYERPGWRRRAHPRHSWFRVKVLLGGIRPSSRFLSICLAQAPRREESRRRKRNPSHTLRGDGWAPAHVPQLSCDKVAG